MIRNSNGIPGSVLRRLPKYLLQAQAVREQGVRWVSSKDLGETLGFTSSTVRQDLSHLNFSGVSRRGYETAGLERALACELGIEGLSPVIVVGAGNLGRALAQHREFKRQGFRICGIFDRGPRAVGKRVGDLRVQPMDELPRLVRRRGVNMGIIAVPAGAAPQVADELIAAGVHGLLNLTSAHLKPPADVVVVDGRIVACLLEVSCTMQARGIVPRCCK